MPNQINFVVSASVTFTPLSAQTVQQVMDANLAGCTFNLPAVDAGNPDLMVTNNGISRCYICWNGGGTSLPVGGQMVLTSNAAVLAAAAGHPNVGNMAVAGSSATTVTASADEVGGSITISRGTASTAAVF